MVFSIYRVDLRVMTMKENSRFPEMEPHHQMQFNVITSTLLFLERGLTPQQGIE